MEAFLLTLDVACIVLLMRNVLRVIKSGKVEELGIFRYSDSPKEGNGVRPSA